MYEEYLYLKDTKENFERRKHLFEKWINGEVSSALSESEILHRNIELFEYQIIDTLIEKTEKKFQEET